LRRFTRLYLVLLPALLVTALLDRSGMALFGSEGVYAGRLDAPYLTLCDVRATGSFGTFVGNFFYLQEIFVRPFGSNGPLWSLSYEFWAYLLFPLAVQAVNRNVALGRRAAYVALAVVILYFGGERLRFYFPLWLTGALVDPVPVVAETPNRSRKKKMSRHWRKVEAKP
jgi:peptidoglycan/LPS O-acetylase OafA/YrhL